MNKTAARRKINAWIAKEKPLKQQLQDFADSLVNGEEKTDEDKTREE